MLEFGCFLILLFIYLSRLKHKVYFFLRPFYFSKNPYTAAAATVAAAAAATTKTTTTTQQNINEQWSDEFNSTILLTDKILEHVFQYEEVLVAH